MAVQQDYDKSKAEKGKKEVKRKRIQREIDVSSSPEIASHTSKFGGSSSTPTIIGGSGTATLNTFWKLVDKQKVDDSLAEMFYACSIPFNVARSPYFKNAFWQGICSSWIRSLNDHSLKKNKGKSVKQVG